MKLSLSVCLLALGVAGCGPTANQKYVNVSGTVKFDGKPLQNAKIIFSKPGVPPTSIDIIDGNYTGQAVAGENIISFTAMRPSKTGMGRMPPEAIAQMKAYKDMGKDVPLGDTTGMQDMIPPDWGTKSTQMRIVEAGAENKFDFTLAGK